MKFVLLIPLIAVLAMANSHAQGRIYRCGNTYTNDAAEAKSKNCKAIEGGNVTVVEGTRVNGNSAVRISAPPATATATAQAQPRVDAADQRARDSDSRRILDAELKKAEARQAELLKEYNNGEPDKLGPETRNYQKYLDRVAELKNSIARNESDIAGIRRELGRAAPSASK
jgi:hypothetical protein